MLYRNCWVKENLGYAGHVSANLWRLELSCSLKLHMPIFVRGGLVPTLDNCLGVSGNSIRRGLLPDKIRDERGGSRRFRGRYILSPLVTLYKPFVGVVVVVVI